MNTGRRKVTSMKTKITGLLALGLALGLGASASAHHSTNLYIDASKKQTIQGTFVALKMANPHAIIQLMAPGKGGKMETWAIETHAPGSLIRLGWKPNTFRKGEKITVIGNPSRNGDPYMNLVEVVFADGYKLSPGMANRPRPGT